MQYLSAGLPLNTLEAGEVLVLIAHVAVMVGRATAFTHCFLTITHYYSLMMLLKPRRRRLLLTTNTDENAMAAPANMGLSRPSAASGIAAVL